MQQGCLMEERRIWKAYQQPQTETVAQPRIGNGDGQDLDANQHDHGR